MISSAALVTSISAIALVLAEERSIEEIAWLACVFSQLGDTLSTIAEHEEFIKNCNNGNDN